MDSACFSTKQGQDFICLEATRSGISHHEMHCIWTGRPGDIEDLTKPITYFGEFKLGEPEKASVFKAGLSLGEVSVALYYARQSLGRETQRRRDSQVQSQQETENNDDQTRAWLQKSWEEYFAEHPDGHTAAGIAEWGRLVDVEVQNALNGDDEECGAMP